MKRFFPMMLALAILTMTVNVAAAQDTTATTTAPTRTVEIFFVACADQVVLNLSGTMTPGYDIYYQVTDIGGNALTGLRQVAVNGTYSVSDRVNYAEGTTLAAGAAGIANVRIAVEGGPNNIDFETTVTDTQDGCASPQNNAVTSTDLGGAGSSGTTTQGPASSNGLVTILTPGGGELNPSRAAEDLVEIGVRQSDVYRSENAGLIFAECDSYARALPGILYDTDNITIYWSWFAKNNARLQEHLANSQYAVRMNGAGLPNAQLALPGLIRGDHWAFYTVPIGNLKPGHYEIEFKLDWTQPISDGYDDYGPGTNNPQVRSLCNFDIRPNETGQSVQWNAMFNPTAGPVHNIQPQF